MRLILANVLFYISILSLYGQNNSLYVGPEYNYYPAGHIIGVQAEYSPNNNHHSFNARLATNITRRWDFSGLNDDERGFGFGGSIGYRYYLTPQCNGLYLGARTDLWFISVDWEDSSEIIQKGTTKITVLQPTFELGYLFRFKKGWELGTAFVNGIELNIKMDGEPVGEGWITLWQIRLSKQIKLEKLQ
ncbi:MAG: hypothetical protein HKP14_05085 [Bacteroidia bacterium]|nr:hypothetical protein [Bacteroidia bacterium]